MIDEHLYRIHIGPAAEVHDASPEALFLRLLHALQDEGLDFEVVGDASSVDGAAPADRHVTVDLAIRLRAGVQQQGSGSVTAGVDRARAALTSGTGADGTRIRDVVVHPVDGVVR